MEPQLPEYELAWPMTFNSEFILCLGHHTHQNICTVRILLIISWKTFCFLYFWQQTVCISKHSVFLISGRHCLLSPLHEQHCPVLRVKLMEHRTNLTFNTTFTKWHRYFPKMSTHCCIVQYHCYFLFSRPL